MRGNLTLFRINYRWLGRTLKPDYSSTQGGSYMYMFPCRNIKAENHKHEKMYFLFLFLILTTQGICQRRFHVLRMHLRWNQRGGFRLKLTIFSVQKKYGCWWLRYAVIWRMRRQYCDEFSNLKNNAITKFRSISIKKKIFIGNFPTNRRKPSPKCRWSKLSIKWKIANFIFPNRISPRSTR